MSAPKTSFLALALTFLLSMSAVTAQVQDPNEPTAEESATMAPSVTISIGHDNNNTQSSLTWVTSSSSLPNLTKSVALRFNAPAAQANHTWVIVMGRVFLDRSISSTNATANNLKAAYPWLVAPSATAKFGDYRKNGVLQVLDDRIISFDLDAMDATPLDITPEALAGVVMASTETASAGNNVKQFGQPFVSGNLIPGSTNYQFSWKPLFAPWTDASVSPSPFFSQYWTPTYSRTKASGDQLMNINRIAETIITYQAPNPNNVSPTPGAAFLRTSNYHTAMSLGLTVSLQVVTLRSYSTAAMGTTAGTVPGAAVTGNPFAGMRISAPIYLRPTLTGTDIGPDILASTPSSLFDLVPGAPALIAIGQSAVCDTAQFPIAPEFGGGFVMTPIFEVVPNSGVYAVMVPLNAGPGEISWLNTSMNVSPTILAPTSWQGPQTPIVSP